MPGAQGIFYIDSMDSDKLRYTRSFLDSVDYVEAGRKGEISENRVLVADYRPEYYPVLEAQLRNPHPAVRKEVVLLLAKLKERKAIGRIREMRTSDTDIVSGACLSYLNGIGEADDAIPKLLDVMRHDSGRDFRTAASKLGTIARDSDIPDIREIYGQVDGELKGYVTDILRSVISRYPELRSKSYLILSDPVYPNEERFRSFLDKSIVYIDIRYADNYSGSGSIQLEMYNKIASAFRKIQIRLYNERANLRYYSEDTKRMFDDAEDLLSWGMKDLMSKDVIGTEREKDTHHCPRCGGKMCNTLTGWICTECGGRE